MFNWPYLKTDLPYAYHQLHELQFLESSLSVFNFSFIRLSAPPLRKPLCTASGRFGGWSARSPDIITTNRSGIHWTVPVLRVQRSVYEYKPMCLYAPNLGLSCVYFILVWIHCVINLVRNSEVFLVVEYSCCQTFVLFSVKTWTSTVIISAVHSSVGVFPWANHGP